MFGTMACLGQAEVLYDAWEIIVLLLLERSAMFQMICSTGLLLQCCSVPWRQSFFGKKFRFFPVTAFVEFICFLTVSRWAGLPCCRMLWFWLQAQHLSTFLLMELNFSALLMFLFAVCLLVQAKFCLYDKNDQVSPPLAQLEISFTSSSVLLPLCGAETKLVLILSHCNIGRKYFTNNWSRKRLFR